MSLRLTAAEREELRLTPAFGGTPELPACAATADRLKRRGLLVPHPVRYLSVPLYTRSRKGERALAVTS